MRPKFLPAIVTCVAVIAVVSAPLRHAFADNHEPVVDIRGDDGKPIVTADQIRYYDWPTHTIMLTQGTYHDLAKRLHRRTPQPNQNSLVTGIPFDFCVDGKPIYRGAFTTPISSKTFKVPVIMINLPAPKSQAVSVSMHIQPGYPGENSSNGSDPRGDERLRQALEATGRLVDKPGDRIRWIESALKEMQRITVGMTRGELLEVFTEEGGLSTRVERHYAYRDCPYIKVDVKFEAVEHLDDREEHKTDKITSISKPYLEWQISD